MYDTNIGRWLQEDPIGFDAGDPNLYRYVGNNVTNATDPTGNVVVLVHGVHGDGKEYFAQMKLGLQRYWDEHKMLSKDMGASANARVLFFKWTLPGDAVPPLGDATSSVGDARNVKDKATMVRYQEEEAHRLQDGLVAIRKCFDRFKCSEPVDIIAHSQGTIISMMALSDQSLNNANRVADGLAPLLIARNFLSLASPHEEAKAHEVVKTILGTDRVIQNAAISGVVYNYYSQKDAIVQAKRGLNSKGEWPSLDKELASNKFKNIDFTADSPTHREFHKNADQANKSYGPGASPISEDFATLYSTNKEFRDTWDAITKLYFSK